jgi:hypothetical protein
MSEKDFLKAQKFLLKAIDQLESEKTLGIALIEYSKTIIDRPDNHAKIVDSFAGHAVRLQNYVILRELRMWCLRVLEANGHSLPNISSLILKYESKLANKRRLDNPSWSETWLESDKISLRVSDFVRNVNALTISPAIKPMRVFRNEELAHLTRGMEQNKSKADSSISFKYSYNDVINIANCAVDLISEAIRIVKYQSPDNDGLREILRSHYESYWNLLPKFSTLEDR